MDQYVGALIGLGFGYGWSIAGAMALRRQRQFVLAFSTVVGALTAILLWRAHAGGEHGSAPHATWMIYNVTVTLEVLAIVASIAWLVRRGRSALIMPVLGVIVGLHFLGLWAATAYAQPAFLFAAIGMVVVCGLAMRRAGPSRIVLTGLGCGGILWLAAASVLV